MPGERDEGTTGDLGDDLDEEVEGADDVLGLDEDAVAVQVGPDPDLPDDVVVELADEGLVIVKDDEEEEEEEVKIADEPAIRPALRPQPGRPPSAREEPPPPFAVGERVRLIQNTRPRTGTLIGNYQVGTTGRVETVLSQTAIVRFDTAPDTKEVVAFTCLESAEKVGDGAGRAP
jgi:hypothetical protein